MSVTDLSESNAASRVPATQTHAGFLVMYCGALNVLVRGVSPYTTGNKNLSRSVLQNAPRIHPIDLDREDPLTLIWTQGDDFVTLRSRE